MERNIVSCPPSSPAARQEYWQNHVTAHEKSGLTLGEYCQRNGLRKATLSWWRQKLRKSQPASTNLVPVSIVANSNSTIFNYRQATSGIAIVTQDGSRIEIGIDFHQSTLERVLRTLGRL